jgi:hypothetical protein
VIAPLDGGEIQVERACHPHLVKQVEETGPEAKMFSLA